MGDFRDALESENIIAAIIWGGLTAFFAVMTVQELLDWWRNYRGVTSDGVVATDRQIVLKRKIRA